jgi:ABC-2 type transport system permease protein
MEATMNTPRGMSLRDKVRVTLAITAKDMLEGLRNKNTLTVVVTVILMIVMYRFLPMITGADDPTPVFVYEAAPSAALADLEFSSAVRVRSASSIDALKRRLGEGNEPELGLVVPADFDARAAAGAPLEIQGYVLHWISQDDALEIVRRTEDAIYEATGLDVSIMLSTDRIYPAVDNDGAAFLASLGVIFALCMLGISFIPHLMIEEKSARTLDALMISPASVWMVVSAKVLTGLTYGLLIGVPSLLIYGPVIMNWGVAGSAILSISIFTISVGLLLGTLLNTRQQLMAWAWVAVIPLMLPPFLVVMQELIPGWLAAVLPWIPTVAASLLIRASAALEIPFDLILRNLAIILVWSGVVLGVTVSTIRRRDR